MDFVQKRYIVGLELSYTVEAESADAAVRAVLPMARDAENVVYTIREEVVRHPLLDRDAVEPYANLEKSVYKVSETAEILGISRNAVYERVPCIRVGRRRLYPRATIIDILTNGLRGVGETIRPAGHTWRQAPGKPSRIFRRENAPPEPSKIISMKDAARLLGLSAGKAKELFDSRRIYSAESYGKRIILRAAVDHFLGGGTARDYVELLIEHAEQNRGHGVDAETVERFAREMRQRWS